MKTTRFVRRNLKSVNDVSLSRINHWLPGGEAHPALPRASYVFTAGFPLWLARVCRSRAIHQGLK